MENQPNARPEHISPTEWSNTPTSVQQLVTHLLAQFPNQAQNTAALEAQIQRGQAPHRVVATIRHCLNLDTIFATTTAATAQLFAPMDCYISRYVAEAGLWRTVADFHHDPDRPTTVGDEIPDAENPFAAQLRCLKRVCLDNPDGLEDAVNQTPARTMPGAWLINPLVVDGQLWGSLALVATQRPLTWSNQQIDLVQTVAHQLEVAIQQAHLYLEVQLELEERQRVEAALQESQARLEAVAANLPGAILRYRLCPDGTDGILYMSPGCDRLWEIEAEAVINDARLLCSMICPDDLPGMRASVMASAQALTPWNWNWRITTPSGVEKWLEAWGQPIREANGNVLWDTLILDVTDRKRAEIALQTSESRFQSLADNVPGVLYGYRLRPDGTDQFTYISSGFREVYGFEPDGALTNSSVVWAMIHPDDVALLQQTIEVSRCTLSTWQVEYRVITPAGQTKWLQGIARPTAQPNGDVIWDGLIVDIGERKQAEEALAASEQRLRAIIEAEPECVKVLALDGTVLEMNPAGLALIDADAPDQVIGLPATTFIQPECRQSFEAMGQRVSQGTAARLEFGVQGLKGTHRWVDSHAVPLRNEHNQIAAILAITRDISDRKQAEEALAASEQKLSTLISNLPGYVYRVKNDPHYTPDFISQGVEAITGHHPDEYLVTRTISCGQEIHPDDAQIVWDRVQQAVGDRSPYECEYRLITKTGQEKWVWERGQGIYDEGGTLLYLEGFVTDISSQKQAEADLRDSEARYRLLAENTYDLVCLHDPVGSCLYISPSCTPLLGYRYDEMRGLSLSQFVHPDDRDRFQAEIEAASTGAKSSPITYRLRHRRGHYLWFETLTRSILSEDANPRVVQLQTTSRDVTERVLAQHQLQHDALHDALTGLPNRHQLMHRLALALSHARADDQFKFGVLFLDLDRFKVINDSLGHLAGDQMLIEIAAKIQNTLGASDLAARLGGDEFVVLLNRAGRDQVVAAAERIFAALANPFTVAGREVHTTVSIGIVLGHQGYHQPEHLLRNADIAMYQAKAKGKARYEIFNAKMHTEALARLHLENDLRRAIDQGDMVLHYQPIVTLTTGTVVGFEALTRWVHPSRGIVSPGEFIPLAEEIGLISQLDYWALATACQQLATWQHRFPALGPLTMSVNLSAQDLRRSDLLTTLDEILASTHLPAHCLTLEITESMLIDDIEATIELLDQIQARQVHISIDDFGTGYSSLSYLHRLPVNYLKVDRSFIHQTQTGQPSQPIVSTIMALGTQLGLETIAEGVETAPQRDELCRLGYRLGQGYLFSHPLAIDQVESLLTHAARRQAAPI